MVGYVYIITNKPHGTLYIGVTNYIERRIGEHKSKQLDGFSKKYELDRLVYVDVCESITAAIQREKTMKHWVRAWKIKAIETQNPIWRDLWDDLNR